METAGPKKRVMLLMYPRSSLLYKNVLPTPHTAPSNSFAGLAIDFRGKRLVRRHRTADRLVLLHPKFSIYPTNGHCVRGLLALLFQPDTGEHSLAVDALPIRRSACHALQSGEHEKEKVQPERAGQPN